MAWMTRSCNRGRGKRIFYSPGSPNGLWVQLGLLFSGFASSIFYLVPGLWMNGATLPLPCICLLGAYRENFAFTFIYMSCTRCGNKETGLLLLLISGHVDDEEEGRAFTRGLPSIVKQMFIHAHRLVWPWPLLEADRVSELRRNNAEC